MKKNLLYVLVLLGIVSCTKEEQRADTGKDNGPKVTTSSLTAEEAERFVLLNTDYTVSKADILIQANALVESFGKEDAKTKGHKINRTAVVSDSIVSTAAVTRADGSGQVPPKIYIVSFGDENGFAMFAGDKRVNGVLTFADEGEYKAEKLHPGMEYLIECQQEYMLSEIDRLEAMRGDSIYDRLLHKYGRFGDRTSAPQTKYPVWNGIEYVDMPVDNISEEFYEYVGETRSRNLYIQSQWGQGWPYDIKVTASYGNVPTGCVATAIAQIMSYYKVGTYNGKTYLWNQFPALNWNGASADALNSIADLFFDLGKADNLNMRYAPGGSSASSKNVPRTFNHYGYNSGNLVDYNQSAAISNLLNQNPVYMEGQDFSNGGYHAWVVDGLQIDEVFTRYRVNYWYQGHLQGSEYIKRDIQNSYYTHLNWGWSGSYNCWSVPGIFDTRGPYNFKNEPQMIGGIKPR